MGFSYNDYVTILRNHMAENGISDTELKTFNPSLEEKLHKEMYKNIIGYYANDATSIKKAVNDNKDFLKIYINKLRTK